MEVVYLIGDLDLEGEGAFEEQAEGPRNPEQEGEYGAINSKEIIAIVACVVIVAPTSSTTRPTSSLPYRLLHTASTSYLLYNTTSSTTPPPQLLYHTASSSYLLYDTASYPLPLLNTAPSPPPTSSHTASYLLPRLTHRIFTSSITPPPLPHSLLTSCTTLPPPLPPLSRRLLPPASYLLFKQRLLLLLLLGEQPNGRPLFDLICLCSYLVPFDLSGPGFDLI